MWSDAQIGLGHAFLQLGGAGGEEEQTDTDR